MSIVSNLNNNSVSFITWSASVGPKDSVITRLNYIEGPVSATINYCKPSECREDEECCVYNTCNIPNDRKHVKTYNYLLQITK